MTITVMTSDATSITANVDGRVSVIPRSTSNGDYVALLGLSGKKLAGAKGVYNAFPEFINLGGSVVGIYSSGEGHGESSRQIMVRSDDAGDTWDSEVYFENKGSVFNCRLLEGLVNIGQNVTLKAFNSERTVNGWVNTILRGIVKDGHTYAPWSPPIQVAGTYYRTGYAYGPPEAKIKTYSRCGLLKSTNGRDWTFVSLIADGGTTLFYGEAAIVHAANGDLVAIVRQDGFNTTRPLHQTKSTDMGATWAALTPLAASGINGVQPFLIRMPDDSIILMVGDRTGFTGLSNNGMTTPAHDHTGIAVWRSISNGVTWGWRTMLAPTWSTDGGQPCAAILPPGADLGYLCYLSPGPTGNDLGIEPEIHFGRFTSSAIV